MDKVALPFEKALKKGRFCRGVVLGEWPRSSLSTLFLSLSPQQLDCQSQRNKPVHEKR